MPFLLSILTRLLALAAALVFAAGALLVTFVAGVLWVLHAGWVRLGGRPLMSIVLTGLLRRGRAGWPQRAHPQPGYAPRRARVPGADITDVEAK